ncbi:unnamed protein product [Closterium sp. Yama58-4]|nr:unnamed protein product [Closterium sp. Yama58-4]
MDTGDTSPCVLLFFERLRLVFNAGEGLQRLCIEHRIRLSKVGHDAGFGFKGGLGFKGGRRRVWTQGDTSPCVLLFFERLRLVFNAGEGLQCLCIEHRIRLSKVRHARGLGFKGVKGGYGHGGYLPLRAAVRRGCAWCSTQARGCSASALNTEFASLRLGAAPGGIGLKVRLVFNAGEGLQRLCIEHRIRLSKVDKIFLSRVCTETAGGLPGMLLTLANTGETGVTVDICGPSDLHRLAAAMRCFVGAASVRTSSFGSSSPGRQSYPHAPLPAFYNAPQQPQQQQQGQQKVLGSGQEQGREAVTMQEQWQLEQQEDKSAYIVHDDGDVKITAVLLEPSLLEFTAAASSAAEENTALAVSLNTSRNLCLKDADSSSAVLPSPSASFKELTLAQQKEGGLAGEGATGVSSKAALPSATSAKRPSPSGTADISSGWETTGGGSEKRPRVEGERREEAARGLEGNTAGMGPGVGAAGMASVVYVCELPTAAGKFDPKRAAAMGIRPGPKYRRLQMGESVPSDDGSRTVHPSDVLEASIPGPVVLLIDCPTASHTQALLQSPQLQRFCISHRQKSKSDNNEKSDSNGSDYKEVTVAVHVSPEAVVEEEQYRRWMGKLGPNITHVLAGHGRDMEVWGGGADSGSHVHPEGVKEQYRRFTSHFFTLFRPTALNPVTSAPQPVEGLPLGPIVIAKNLLKVNLRGAPVLGVDTSAVPPAFNARSTVHHLLHNIPELEEASRKVAADWGLSSKENEGEKMGEQLGVDKEDNAPACLQGMGREEVEVVFLGTGSSQPSKYRNLSGIYVHLFDRGGMILDCGEGSYAQLTRRFGPEKAEDIIAGLKCIWISHIHADHHTGLVRILAARRDILLRRAAQRAAERAVPGAGSQKTFEKMETDEQDKNATVPVPPILVVGPKQLRRYLEAYQTFESLHLTRQLGEVLSALGLTRLESVPVVHCPQAFAVVLEGMVRGGEKGRVRGRKKGRERRREGGGEKEDSWKLVYSGDTRPCDTVRAASRGATVLIHEATFEDDLQHEAIARKHSTTSEAVEVGASAPAYLTILTHFSQRYPKIPRLAPPVKNKKKAGGGDVEGDGSGSAAIAFDLMSVNFCDLPRLPELVPVFQLLFRDALEEEEEEQEEGG